MLYFFALLLGSANVFATTPYSHDVYSLAEGRLVATAQFVNRAQVAVSLENAESRKRVCVVALETMGYSSGPFLDSVEITVWPESVNAVIGTVKGNQEFGAIVKSISCRDPIPLFRFPRGKY